MADFHHKEEEGEEVEGASEVEAGQILCHGGRVAEVVEEEEEEGVDSAMDKMAMGCH